MCPGGNCGNFVLDAFGGVCTTVKEAGRNGIQRYLEGIIRDYRVYRQFWNILMVVSVLVSLSIGACSG